MGKWIVAIVLIALLAGAGYAGVKLYPYYRLYSLRDTAALTLDETEKKAIFIPSKSSLESVAALLEEKKLLDDKASFLFFAGAKNYRKHRIVPGKYVVKGTMTYNSLVNHLRAGNGRLAVKVTFNSVGNVRKLAAIVATQIEPSEAELLKVFLDPTVHKAYGFSNEERFSTIFLPDTYRMNWATSARAFVKRMARAYKKFWTPRNKAKAKRLKLTQTGASILASLVQSEQSKRLDEWPKIAGLYLNRLKRGMKLEADPTVKFALGKPGLRRILFKHLKVDSPYNTYKYHGLPPGPLRIPDKRAIRAVLNPMKHRYIFMCAKPEYSGYHNFSRTIRQHNRYARMYHRWLRKEGIR